MKKDGQKTKAESVKSKPNNSNITLSSYLPKDVLEEIDINDSSKTNSLSKNSSSDKSMDKTTKSQTNHNNNNGTSDSNGNSNNSNDNGKSGNSNSGSNEENNLSSRSLPNENLIRKKSEQLELAKNLSDKNHSYHEHWNNLIKLEKFEEINNNEFQNDKDENKDIDKNDIEFNTEIKFNEKNIDNSSNINNINNINKKKKNYNNYINNIRPNKNISINKSFKRTNHNFKNTYNNNYIMTENNIFQKNQYEISNSNKIPINLIKKSNNNNYLYQNGINGTNKNNQNLNFNISNNLGNNLNNNYINLNINGFNNSINENMRNYNDNNIDGDIFNFLKNNKNNMYSFNSTNNNINNLSLSQIITRQNNNIFNPFYSNQINNIYLNGLERKVHLNNLINNTNNNFNYQVNNNINLPFDYNNYLQNYNSNNSNNTFLKVNQLLNQNGYNPNLQGFNLANSNQNMININAQIQNKINNELIKALLFNQNLNSQLNHPMNLNSNNFRNNNNNPLKKINNTNKIINPIKEKDLTDAQLDHLFSQFFNSPKEGCPLFNVINKKGVPFFINLTRTIKGSKYLQKILYTNPPKQIEVDFITKIICINYKEIMCDYYGNYFLQLFFLHCNSKNRLDILNSLKNEYVNIANDICGNHSLQCLISLQSTNEEKEIIKFCIINNISKIIKCIKEPERQYINAFVINNLKKLCFDPNGICIVKEFIYNIKSNLYIKLIITNFEKDMTNLTLNQYGNFAIQEAIKFFGYNYCKNIINSLIKNIVKFSISKYSSNVIDFLLEYLSKKEFHKFCISIRKIFLKENNFKEMIKHKYSIFVIENSLELLIKINENYYINSMKNNLGNNFEEENGNISDEMEQDNEYTYQNFCKLKQKIFQFIENNSAAKEKKKIISLIKTYKHTK